MNGCSDTSACVTVSSIGLTSGSSPVERGEVVVFPNPNNGEFTIQSSNKGTYTIINELGQALQTIQLNDANNHLVNIGNLSSGVYFIVGYNNNEMTRQKVVVVK